MENIFRVEGSYDRLQANIEDYLENNLKNRLERPVSSRQERRRTQTGDAGRGDTRPVNGFAEPAPVAEQLEDLSSEKVQPAEAMEQAAAGQEAELVAQVLRNFFSS